MTRMPRVSDSATFSAACRQTLQRRNSASPSFHSFVCLSKVRGVEATVKFATAAPLGVNRSSGSAVRLPTTVMTVSPGHGSAYLASGRMTLVRSTDSLRLSWRSSSLTAAGSAVEVDDGVDALGLLVDLVGQPARPQMSTFSTVPPSLRTTVRNWSRDGSDGALLELGVEDDHQFVMTHASNPPPLDSAATVVPWQEGRCVKQRVTVPARRDPERVPDRAGRLIRRSAS